MTERDDDLGRSLHELPVPEHRAGFWSRLDRRLAAERAVPGPGWRRGVAGGPAVAGWRRWGPLLLAAVIVAAVIVIVLVSAAGAAPTTAAVLAGAPAPASRGGGRRWG